MSKGKQEILTVLIALSILVGVMFALKARNERIKCVLKYGLEQCAGGNK